MLYMSLAQLDKLAAAVRVKLQLPPQHELRLRYDDEDGDRVVIANDAELCARTRGHVHTLCTRAAAFSLASDTDHAIPCDDLCVIHSFDAVELARRLGRGRLVLHANVVSRANPAAAVPSAGAAMDKENQIHAVSGVAVGKEVSIAGKAVTGRSHAPHMPSCPLLFSPRSCAMTDL